MNVSLKKWDISDAKDLAEVLSNKKIHDNLRDGLPYPYTEHDGREFITSVLASDENEMFSFAIMAAQKVIGSITAVRQGNIHRQTAELGYYIAEEYWGRGIMAEAVRQFCEHVFETSDIIRIFAEPFSYNTASRRVLEKNGFRLEGTMRQNACKNGRLQDMELYALLKEERCAGDIPG